jgi:site-specific recombinase XerD
VCYNEPIKKHSTTHSPAASGGEEDPQFEIVPAEPDTDGAADVTLVPATGGRLLTRAEFRGLAEVPAEVEWFQNLDNPRTRAAYKIDVGEFMRFIGIATPKEFRDVTRSHVLAWRKNLEGRALQPATIRRKLSALASLFDYLCEKNAIATNPVDGVKRPKADMNEGKTPAISDGQARVLLAAPPADTLKGQRDRAILATFLFHGLRLEELLKLRPKDMHQRQGVIHLRIRGKGSKTRYVPAHPAALETIDFYLDAAGHRQDVDGPLFRPVKNPSGDGDTNKALSPSGIYHRVLRKYAKAAGIAAEFSPHSLRATAATNALDNGADIAQVQAWLGHANISTTRLYDRRRSRAEDSPTFKVAY